MATRKKKRVKKIKFELTRSSIGGIGVVCFCIFLWMFLLGVWAGQSLLLPSSPTMVTASSPVVEGEEPVNFEDQKKRKPGKP